MKRKSIITMMLAIALVAAVGIGSTLALLSTKSNDLKNTFVAGDGYEAELPVVIDEQDIALTAAPGDRTSAGNAYTNILPGSKLIKDPMVTLNAPFPASFVFVKVTGLDEVIAKGFAPDLAIQLKNTWKKADAGTGYDGLYYYAGSVGNAIGGTGVGSDAKIIPAAATGSVALSSEKLFNSLTLDITMTDAAFAALQGDDGIDDILIQACAVQAENSTYANALTVAQGLIP